MSLHSQLNRPHRRETLSQSALWSLLGTLVYTGCQWGVLAATVRLTNPAEVGMLSLGFAISAPIFLFLQLRLRSASATDVNHDFMMTDYVNLRLICTSLAFLLTLIISAVCRFSVHQMWIIALISLAKSLESGSDLLYGFFQRANDMRIISLSMVGRGVLSLGCFTSLVFFTRSIVFGLAGLCLGWAIIFLMVDLPYSISALHSKERSIFHFQWQPAAIWTLSIVTLPLGVATLLVSISANLPRYFIERYLGPSELGIFSAIGYLAMMMSVVVTALAESGIARMAQLIADGDLSSARRLLTRIVYTTRLLSIFGVIGSVLFGGRLIGLLYGKSYASAESLLTWMMLASGFANLASVYGFALVSGKKYGSYLQTLLAVTIVMSLCSAFMIPRWGTRGAVFACIIAYAAQWTFSYFSTRSMLSPALNGPSSQIVPTES